jgi:hypothetical protein
MTISPALRDAMDVLDNHAETMGSGPYCEMAQKMKSVADAMGSHTVQTKRAFALELMVDVPLVAAANAAVRFTRDRAFMSKLVRRKGIVLRKYDPDIAAIIGQAWKIELTEALTPYCDPETLFDVRDGIMILLVARSSFLPHIIRRLDEKAITPQMLCPRDFAVALADGDEGSGPGAKQFLYMEPRMLRWLLGRGELEPWPQLSDDQPKHVNRLIELANAEGGDNRNVNAPCPCNHCLGVPIPTLEDRVCSLAPSECGSEGGEQMVV